MLDVQSVIYIYVSVCVSMFWRWLNDEFADTYLRCACFFCLSFFLWNRFRSFLFEQKKNIPGIVRSVGFTDKSKGNALCHIGHVIEMLCSWARVNFRNDCVWMKCKKNKAFSVSLSDSPYFLNPVEVLLVVIVNSIQVPWFLLLLVSFSTFTWTLIVFF